MKNEINKTTEETALELLKAMLYIMQKNEGEIQMNMPESIDYDNALEFIRKNEKV